MSGSTNSGRGGDKKARNEKLNPAKETDTFEYDMPRTLPVDGKFYWKRNIPKLKASGAIKGKDYDSFLRLCQMYAMFCKCQKIVEEKGCTYESLTDRGAIKILKRPEMELALSINKDIMVLERKFGLTPADGEKLKLKAPSKKSKLDRFR